MLYLFYKNMPLYLWRLSRQTKLGLIEMLQIYTDEEHVYKQMPHIFHYHTIKIHCSVVTSGCTNVSNPKTLLGLFFNI